MPENDTSPAGCKINISISVTIQHRPNHLLMRLCDSDSGVSKLTYIRSAELSNNRYIVTKWHILPPNTKQWKIS